MCFARMSRGGVAMTIKTIMMICFLQLRYVDCHLKATFLASSADLIWLRHLVTVWLEIWQHNHGDMVLTMVFSISRVNCRWPLNSLIC